MINKIEEVLKNSLVKETRSQMWERCFNHISQVPMTEENLNNMARTELVYGIYGGYSGNESNPVSNRLAIENLAKATGVMGVQNPEGGVNPCPVINNETLTDTELLMRIEKRIGFKINLPEFTGNSNDLQTDYGMISDRICAYLWIMKRIVDLFPVFSDSSLRVIEIGAGMGFMGYFLNKIGYFDYTIIDLAYSNALQTYVLHKNLPNRKIIMSGDVTNPFDEKYHTAIKILHASDFKDVPTGRFDIMINIDGMTEMNLADAHTYINSDCAKLFLSINHEMNDYRVIDVCQATRVLKYRYPFWIRPGYVEELYQSVFL
jgi:hypothetical protein